MFPCDTIALCSESLLVFFEWNCAFEDNCSINYSLMYAMIYGLIYCSYKANWVVLGLRLVVSIFLFILLAVGFRPVRYYNPSNVIQLIKIYTFLSAIIIPCWEKDRFVQLTSQTRSNNRVKNLLLSKTHSTEIVSEVQVGQGCFVFRYQMHFSVNINIL